MKARRLAALARATESRERKFLIAARELLRGAPELRPKYAKNPLVCATCVDEDEANDSGDLGTTPARWVRDAHSLCDWPSLPPALDVAHPDGGHVPADRGKRKREQLLNISMFVAPALRIQPNAIVVDFGCGGGHQTLTLAHHFPSATFILVDLKLRSLDVAAKRINAAGLRNVIIKHMRIEDFNEPFDLGVALHACGGASDAALQKCIENNATFIVAPCCVGKIGLNNYGVKQFDRVGDMEGPVEPLLTYPRSKLAQRATDRSSYVTIAKAADFAGHCSDESANGVFTNADEDKETNCPYERESSSDEAHGVGLETMPERDANVSRCTEVYTTDKDDLLSRMTKKSLSIGEMKRAADVATKKIHKNRATVSKYSPELLTQRTAQRLLCKALIETDRLMHAKEHGYQTWHTKMEPKSCTPKNDMLIGVFESSEKEIKRDADAPSTDTDINLSKPSLRVRLLREYHAGLVLADTGTGNDILEALGGKEGG